MSGYWQLCQRASAEECEQLREAVFVRIRRLFRDATPEAVAFFWRVVDLWGTEFLYYDDFDSSICDVLDAPPHGQRGVSSDWQGPNQ